MPWYKSIETEEIEKITNWFDENRIIDKECFYQMDKVQENLPELGIIVFKFLIKNRLWYPKEE